MNILLTAIGKRVQLVKELKKSCEVFGTDCSNLAPAKGFVDKFFIVSKYDNPNYIEQLLGICKREKIHMLIPLFEKEYELLCENREKFKNIGTVLLLSSKEVIISCNDKWKTYNFFSSKDILTPFTFKKGDNINNLDFPLIIKPKMGMGSSNVFKINNLKQFEFFVDYVEEPIIQKYIEGTEYTVDVLADLNGNILSIVPRERLEVRAGEVTKSRTVKDTLIIEKTFELCSKLKGIGPITVQCIKDCNGNIFFIEVNPRFGGGVPLTFQAGIDYGELFIKMLKGEKIETQIGNYKEVTMLRYDEAVYD